MEGYLINKKHPVETLECRWAPFTSSLPKAGRSDCLGVTAAVCVSEPPKRSGQLKFSN